MSDFQPEQCDLLIEAGYVVPIEPHAVVLEESLLPPSARALTVKERFERAVYLADDRSIHAVYGCGRKIK